MPGSSDLFIQEVEHVIRELNPSTVLDIGAGAGKYGTLIKRILPEAIVEAVEPDGSYIPRFNLQNIYHTVHNLTAKEYMNSLWGTDKVYDLVVFGDVIEHMLKSEGKDILEFFCYRTKHIIVLYPDHYIQYNYEGDHPLENHVSIWHEGDFSNFDYSIEHKEPIHMVKIKGYLGA